MASGKLEFSNNTAHPNFANFTTPTFTNDAASSIGDGRIILTSSTPQSASSTGNEDTALSSTRNLVSPTNLLNTSSATVPKPTESAIGDAAPDNSQTSSDTNSPSSSSETTSRVTDTGDHSPPTTAIGSDQTTNAKVPQSTGSSSASVTPPTRSGSTGSSQLSPSPSITTASTHAPQDKRATAGIIAGAVTGGLMCTLVLFILLCLRRSRSFASFLPAKLVRTRSTDTIRSFMPREFSPLPTETQHRRVYPGQNRLLRSSSIENLIPPRIATDNNGARNKCYPTSVDPFREHLLSEQMSEASPILPTAVRFRPPSLLSPDASSMSSIDFHSNTNIESDYQRRINTLEMEVQRLQSERDYLACLTFDEELPDYSSRLNSPSPRFSLRNSSRNSIQDKMRS